jgi:hypothetical protein
MELNPDGETFLIFFSTVLFPLLTENKYPIVFLNNKYQGEHRYNNSPKLCETPRKKEKNLMVENDTCRFKNVIIFPRKWCSSQKKKKNLFHSCIIDFVRLTGGVGVPGKPFLEPYGCPSLNSSIAYQWYA